MPKYRLPKRYRLIRSIFNITYQEAAGRCCSHPVQLQEDPEGEAAGQSCPQEAEAAARQHRSSEIRPVPSGSGSNRRTAVAGVEQREHRQLRKPP